jgi:hypothetical protein
MGDILMKKAMRVFDTVLAVIATFLFVLTIVWTIQDYMWMLDYPPIIWMDVVMEVFIVMVMGMIAWMFWWNGIFKHVIDKDKQYILQDLLKEFTEMSKTDKNTLHYLVMEMFNNLPPREQIKVLTKVVERRKHENN